jgi:transcriptional regulator
MAVARTACGSPVSNPEGNRPTARETRITLMYIPAAFAETDLTKLHDFIEQHSFGLLVSQVEGLPFATHLPFLLERTTGPHGTLVCHVARANPHWQEADGQTALAIFSGPHVYVSPTWYEVEQVVPTWNYASVHAYGRVQIIEDESALLGIVQEMVRVYEQPMPRPWSFDASSTFVKRLLGQIVGFRIEIDKIEGKWKLNQNHPVERRRKVVRALRQRGDENALAVAAMMQARLPSEG